MENIELIQPHTVRIYGLDKLEGVVETIPAKFLLHPLRLDLYAKLFYIRYRKERPDVAEKVYIDHIKAFNPDGKEPGRDDKNGFEDFLNSFDALIDCFNQNNFDAEKSIVPVGKGNVILDGSHRVAALAFFNRDVTICRYDVEPKAMFDYHYFLNRGLPFSTADLATIEMLRWHQDARVACLWPKIGNGNQKQLAENVIKSNFPICYVRDVSVKLQSLIKLVIAIYKNQDWVGTSENGYAGAFDKAYNCFSHNRKVRFVFFVSNSNSETLEVKEKIREMYPFGKHSVHISDNVVETQEIARIVLSEEGRLEWQGKGSLSNTLGSVSDCFHERVLYFQKVTWINMKVWIYQHFIKRNNR